MGQRRIQNRAKRRVDRRKTLPRAAAAVRKENRMLRVGRERMPRGTVNEVRDRRCYLFAQQMLRDLESERVTPVGTRQNKRPGFHDPVDHGLRRLDEIERAGLHRLTDRTEHDRRAEKRGLQARTPPAGAGGGQAEAF
jgi:hypothetical protein